jgi:endonuclease/exonuclease/phosphatase family metal-dependent hydrolase
MMGDFNDWPRRGPVAKALANLLPASTFHRTFPARWPLFILDRIYCRPREALVSSWVDRDGRTASDHLPVLADIALSPQKSVSSVAT